MKESFVNRKYFVEVLGVHIHFVTQIRHGRRDVGCMIGRHFGKRFEGEDADVFVARCDAGCKGRHGYGFCCEAMRLKFVGLFRKKSPKKACGVALDFLVCFNVYRYLVFLKRSISVFLGAFSKRRFAARRVPLKKR